MDDLKLKYIYIYIVRDEKKFCLQKKTKNNLFVPSAFLYSPFTDLSRQLGFTSESLMVSD